jgi:hypothetical protein
VPPAPAIDAAPELADPQAKSDPTRKHAAREEQKRIEAGRKCAAVVPSLDRGIPRVSGL